MGRSPCCSKEGLNRGAWTATEDRILTAYITANGEGKWRNLPKRAGLKRCGKSCRLRWLNYLRPDIKRGNISHDEEELIIRLHKLLGNRWSLIAGRLPGRTDNEIKNYWNTTLRKKASAQSTSPQSNYSRRKRLATEPNSSPQPAKVIRTKATRCTKVLIPSQSPPLLPEFHPSKDLNSSLPLHCGAVTNEEVDQDLDLLNFLDCRGFQDSHGDGALLDFESKDLALEDPPMFKDLANSASLEDNANLDLDSLVYLLDSEEWPLH